LIYIYLSLLFISGDTDSVMVQFPTSPLLTTRDEILADIYRQAHEVEKVTTALFPAPNAVEYESCKTIFLMTSKKKVYAAIEYSAKPGGWNLTPKILVKGFTIKKRDKAQFVQKIGMDLMDIILHQSKPVEEWIPFVMGRVNDLFDNCPTTLDGLEPFIISSRLGEDYKTEEALCLTLAENYARETGTRPRAGTRLQYVVGEFTDGRKHIHSAVTPSTFLKDGMCLDTAWYLEKQVQQSLKQVLDLHPAQYLQLEKAIKKLVQHHKFQVQRSRASRHWSTNK
jgi:DNA polymerase elongation subunit (family B)